MTTAGVRCGQPGCTGAIEDGYCNVCGIAGPSESTAAASTPSGASSPSGVSSASGVNSASGVSSASRVSAAGSTRRSRGSTGQSARGRLGAGLIEIPPVPRRDPATAVLADPQVPEAKRFCGTCERPVGRSRDGRPGLAEGYCPNCGTRFSFSPKLTTGELVAGQYEVHGCIAHGGLGWIYLATDRNLSNRWVVLKGLLNSGDAAAQEAAVAERRFLAEVEHPNIVGVYNFVQHADRNTGESAGYIVMEYVGGKSLRQILLERRSAGGGSLPLPVALAYLIEVLPALGYLHSRGLVYCDFKPDNVIQTDEQLKIIDMGGVRRIDDTEGAIYGTVGYQAPEIADDGPSVTSDLYTVGRALAVLTFEFSGYQGKYAHSLPDPATVPVLAEHESFLRALRRATHADPARRFGSAGEMAEQLTGVLREVLCEADRQPRPAYSTLFSPELQAIGVPAILAAGAAGRAGAAGAAAGAPGAAQAGPTPSPDPADITAGMPVPQVDPADPAAGYLAALGTAEAGQLIAVLEAAVAGSQGAPQAVAESVETLLALTRARIVSGDVAGAWKTLANLTAVDEDDWRVTWYQGLAELAAWNPSAARRSFDSVCDILPGEPAAKLALAFAAEADGDHAAAARCFRLVWTVDRSFVSAAFGLARTALLSGDRKGAVEALRSVPQSAAHHLAARVAAVRILASPEAGQHWVSPDDLADAGQDLSKITLDPAASHQVTAEVLRAALGRLQAAQPLGPGDVLGCQPTERSLRLGLERSYRAQAQLAADRHHRIALVDLANDVRPSTWS